MRQRYSGYWYWTFLLIALVAMTGCKEKPVKENTQKKPPVVKVVTPVVRDVVDYAFFTGRTEAVDSVDVQSRVTGYLDSIDFKPGARVKKGQRLFLIDPRPYQATLDNANGNVKLAEAKLKLAIADYNRAKAIAKTPGAISQQDLDKYAAAENEAYASVEAAKASAELARLNVEFTNVVSPIDGVVGRNLITLGNLVKQDTTLLTTVVSEDPIYAYFDIDEPTMLRLLRMIQEGKITPADEKKGFHVDMGLADEDDRYPHDGTIDFINNRVDKTTGTLQMRATFPNPLIGSSNVRLLASGMFVRIRLPINLISKALLVPQVAICTDQGRKYLLVVNSEDIVEYRPVELGPEQPGGLQAVLPIKMVRTKDGLQIPDLTTSNEPTIDSIEPNDRVIISGLQRVRPGVRVEARPAETIPDARTPAAIKTKPKTS